MVNNSSTKQAVLNTLINQTDYISGEVISNKLGVSRVAVNKAVNSLRAEGYKITSVTNKGYLLIKSDIFKEVLASKLTGALKGINVIVKNQTTSTNADAKAIAESGETAVVIAKTQTGGVGRNGRKFHSLNGGLYFSLILRPNLNIADGVKITTFTAVAVSRAIEKLTGLDVKIKWVNDLFISNKKACGILTEASCDFERNKLSYAVVGVGINVDEVNFPLDVKNIATSLSYECKKNIDKNELLVEILNSFNNLEEEILSGNYLSEYKRRCFILGKKVTVYSGLEEYEATALDITESGSLVVLKGEEKRVVSSGEVSVKINE